MVNIWWYSWNSFNRTENEDYEYSEGNWLNIIIIHSIIEYINDYVIQFFVYWVLMEIDHFYSFDNSNNQNH